MARTDDQRDRCGFGGCPNPNAELDRGGKITVEWYRDTDGHRTHMWMAFCSWKCLDDWRQWERIK